MSFANPWGLLALTALPVIAAIHLFHRRYPRLEVAGLHLWGVAQMTHTPGRRRERLPITASLILELLHAYDRDQTARDKQCVFVNWPTSPISCVF